MAAGGYREFIAGEILSEDLINDYLMQGVLVFAGTAARGSAITAPVEGQFSFLADSDGLEFFDGSAWVELSTTPGAAVVSGTTGSPTVGTVSSGGTTYNVYSFTGDGSITFSEAGFAELLIIGGGGGGGIGIGAGGGAGGHLHIESAYLPAGTATVVVGAGGLGGVCNAASDEPMPGNNGRTSYVGSYYSLGGGAGAAFVSQPGTSNRFPMFGFNGGSGGGAADDNAGAKIGGVGVTGLGKNGGKAHSLAGGGGGGAGAAGQDAANADGGNGGDGLANSITGTSVTRAGGGGGSSNNASTGTGGTGGGGNSGANANGSNGTANTGGGGGGSYNNGAATQGGNGGSGIVIVRVAV